MKRYETLDWLRGITACSIMLYHLISWTLWHPQSGSLLGNLGIYGVSIFFVLSGLSMGIVYHHFIRNYKSSLIFFIRRLFRLLPLLWIVVIIITLDQYYLTHYFDLTKFLLNITLLYGFLAPSEYINVGAWSIGNECVYYAFTPLLLLLYNKRKLFGNLALLMAILIGFFFAFYSLDSNLTLARQWNTYINPFNNIFLYFSGLALYYNFHELKLKCIAPILIISSIAVLYFYPVSGDQIHIVTDFNRLILSTTAIILTLGFYKLEMPTIPAWLSKTLSNIGEATYGIYLIHPVIFLYITRLFNLNPYSKIFITIILTILISNLLYYIYEKPFIKIGKRLTNRINTI
jgi:peptidoglycan/LPS O-acetylase OafA/YrhL